eukprot:gnl/MRDRNA2_/MRDRNA2_68970_c0_seq1.p1 gnl/MRDRNA2_/MRDRNA2_68970_c0~~gnl/MRDRNA2_/MRDRNA2_68970_c0_seq1.p1  ORF type:complete len:109 (-),score=16.79 gnl/MRDRNA2_/MRDRNA2_68970_c0_seq1:210-536(-)
MGYSVSNAWPLVLPQMEDPHVRAVAARCARTPAQVLLRWALQIGCAIIPKSATKARIAENFKLFDFTIPEEEMRLLNGLVSLAETTSGRYAPEWTDDVYGLRSLGSLV